MQQKGAPRSKTTQGIWNKLTGAPGVFSVENRAFNYVSAVTFFLLVYFLIFNIYREQLLLVGIILVLIAVVSCVYYAARRLRKFRYGLFIYAFSGYAALICNYFLNSGIDGTTFSLFFLTFMMLIVISKPRYYSLWILLHIGVLISLLTIEYVHPEWVTYTYRTRTERFITMGVAYLGSIGFIFLITKYLTESLEAARIVTAQKEKAVFVQNAQIKAKNETLEKMNDEKNKLFSIISHDLRSPLDSIRGYLELLSGNVLSEEDLANVHDELLSQTKYTSDLLLNLLYWSKTQMQGMTIVPVSLQLKELVEEVTGNKLPLAAKKNIKITHSIKPDIEVIADKEMLRIVLRNLVNNAIKFTKPGGEVYIRVNAKGNEAEISIRDTGIGIPKDRQNEIFKLKTTSTYGTQNEKGIGLGLMLCKEFVEYMSGRIWFVSEEGVGTVFYIALPMPRK